MIDAGVTGSVLVYGCMGMTVFMLLYGIYLVVNGLIDQSKVKR